jgi:inorganic triphosphatase YgiF
VITDATERELQFAAPDLAAAKAWILAQPRHALYAFRLEGSKTQDDAYMDTDDWAIHRAGFAFRVRRRGEAGEVTLKTLDRREGALQERREISQPYSEFESGEGTPGSPAAAVKLITNGRPLQTLFRAETLRTDFAILQDERRLATLSLDDAKIIVGEECANELQRVEVEESAPDGLTRLEPFLAALQQACRLTPVSQSKFEAGLEAAALRPEAALDFGYAVLSPDATAGEYAYALLRGYFADFLRHEPGTRLGEDPEELHDMRVATRKLRAAISLFKPLLPLRFSGFRDELKWVGTALAPCATWTFTSNG